MASWQRGFYGTFQERLLTLEQAMQKRNGNCHLAARFNR